MTVALYLMTQKGLAVLGAAIETGVEISHVVTAPATGMDDDAHTTITSICKRTGIPVFLHAGPPSYDADVTIAAGWRKLLDVDPLVVLHDSLLPRYRGFAPLITALVNGEREVGVTAFRAVAEPDTGPVIAQRSLPIAYPARVADVLARLQVLYAELAAEVCATVREGLPLRTVEQDHPRATYSVWRDDQDYRIDWSRDDRRIVRLVDAVSAPFPGAWTTLAGEQVRVHAATAVADVPIEDRQPGKILRLHDGTPTVVCGTGLVRLDDLRAQSGMRLHVERLRQRFA